MKVRFLFWTGKLPTEIPIRELFLFSKHSEEVFEEYMEVEKSAVAAGVAEVLDNLDL
jgi:hypothetical protein